MAGLYPRLNRVAAGTPRRQVTVTTGVNRNARDELPRVGDRVTVEGRRGVFFVVVVDNKTHSASLLPADDGRILKDIFIEALKVHLGQVN